MLRGSLLARTEHMAEAERVYRQVLAVRRSILGSTHLSTRPTEFSLAALLVRNGRYEAAKGLPREREPLLAEREGPYQAIP